ncbi:MAG: SUMF1/EgtB/PvdO family nonheme iron enzyme [Gammaproteobacteria bacterium]|nr:SUMF1/EgtB/PvdO family nonheme iron enzyme [Gammaproteobacteria bacterium]
MLKPTALLLLLSASILNIHAQPTTSSEVSSSPNEGDTNHTNYFLLQLSRQLTTDVSVDFETKDGTAIAGKDYTEASGTATINAGTTSTTIGVEIIGDTVNEPDETFSLILSNPQGVSFPAGVTSISKTRTIVNDDLSSGSSDPTTNSEIKVLSETTNSKGRKEVTFSDNLVFISIPATTFTMGDDRYEVLGASPEHQVTITKDFWISKNLITNAQFKKFVEEKAYVSDMEKSGATGCWVYVEDGQFEATVGRNWKNAFASTSSLDNHPVTCVSYNDAIAYANWLSTKIGLAVDLATEAQWELSAKGTIQKKYPWGDSDPDGTKLNFCDKSYFTTHGTSSCQAQTAVLEIEDGYAKTSPVGSYPAGASEFGVLDMAGNLGCLVKDYMADYTSEAVVDPLIKSTDVSETDIRAVNRGSSWVDVNTVTEEKHTIYTVTRNADEVNSADDHMGFRVVINTESIQVNQ